MLTNRGALGALVVIGVVAAGSGAYIANRQATPAHQTSAASDVTLPATGAVTETENSLNPAPAPTAAPAPAPAPAPSVAPAPVKPASRTAATRESASHANAAPSRPAARNDRQPSRPSYSPSPATSQASAQSNPAVTAAIEPVESTTVERRPAAPEPPQKQFEELTIPADSVIGLQVETAVSSEHAKVEDPVKARVTRDLKVRDQVAIPAGARAEGSVTLVDRGGRVKDQARLGIRFHTIVLADGTRVPVNTETIYRDGDAVAKESAAKIGGGSVGGAVLGAILGGKKGAIIGTTIGAGAGTAAVMAGEPSTATLPAGSTVTVRMNTPATVTVEK